jgi:hypothetical protein
MPPAENTPDFDKMSPEEIMRWMESLAKKQGASEGFTTDANMEIADIDPNSVVIDEPGYVPSEGKSKRAYKAGQMGLPGAKPAAPPPAKPTVQAPPPAQPKPAAAQAAPPAKPVAPAPPPAKPTVQAPPPAQPKPAAAQAAPPPAKPTVQAPPPAQPKPAAAAPPPAPAKPAAQMPLPTPPAPAKPTPPPTPKAAEPEMPMGLSWLESLAADQGGDFPDLSSLGAELTTAAPPPAAPAASGVNPIDWLENLSEEAAAPVDAAQAADLFGNADPTTWLESLAKGEGAKTEELFTPADLNIPTPETVASDGPGYTPYTFDTLDFTPKTPEVALPFEEPAKPTPVMADAASLDDPAAWLDSLAESQGVDLGRKPAEAEAKPAAVKQMSDAEIQAALARGEVVPHDQMEAWMSRQLEVGAQRQEPPELEGGDAYDPDAPAVPADLPDWLIEQVGQAPPMETVQPKAPPPAPPVVEKPPFADSIVAPAVPVQDMPDWLQADVQAHSELEDSIFAFPTEGESTQPITPAVVSPPPAPAAQIAPSPEIDTSDRWVEAFEIEYQERHGGVKPAEPAPVVSPPPIIQQPAAQLAEAALEPETGLPAGQADALPDWLSDALGEAEVAIEPGDVPDWLAAPVEAAAPAAAVITGEVPDWLHGADVLDTSEIPDWLKETLESQEQLAIEKPAPSPTALVTAVPSVRPPAPVPVQVQQIDAAAVLDAARGKLMENDINAALEQYELLIRANALLDTAVDDLNKVADKVKTNPAVYRVLGDGLMRTGQLQAALDTYRKALNQL